MPARQSSEYFTEQNRTYGYNFYKFEMYIPMYLQCTLYYIYFLGPSLIFIFSFFLDSGGGKGQGKVGGGGGPLSMNTARQNGRQNNALFFLTEHVQQCKLRGA
jgi:hypothetical protein